jgi:enoyl-CoA hydratase
VRNAIRQQTIREIFSAVTALADDSTVRVIVIRGEGAAAFSSGADLKELRGKTNEERDDDLEHGWGAALRAIEQSPKPVIAAVNGYAIAGGTELALACHIRIAAESARFGQVEILRGHIPGAGGTVRLPRLIGTAAALYYLLTGELIDAPRAYQLGLVAKVVADDALDAETLKLAHQLAALSPIALKLTLQSTLFSRDASLEPALAFERAQCVKMRLAPEFKEGIDQFFASEPKA